MADGKVRKRWASRVWRRAVHEERVRAETLDTWEEVVSMSKLEERIWRESGDQEIVDS